MWIIKLGSMYWTGRQWLRRQADALRFEQSPDVRQLDGMPMEDKPYVRVVELETLRPTLSDTASGPDGHEHEKERER